MSGTESTPRPRPLESGKIIDAHRAKLAVVYVRQSTPQRREPASPVEAGLAKVYDGDHGEDEED